ncbi:MAG: hypothetical protein HON90_04010, partial [Halobacteriovoraceae bacterium]|nr:hypothetical protein [Halobacteriovoraceae bacterium]
LKKEGEIFYYKCNDTSFNYRSNNFLKRGDIILSAEVVHEGIDHEVKNKIKQYLDYRKETQPLTTKNCGSVFKNLPNFRAGEIIDGIGLKGFGLENIHVSFMHANFIENNGTGTSDEFVELIHELSEEIERISGLKFEFEVKVY